MRERKVARAQGPGDQDVAGRIVGRRPVLEALRSGRTINKLLIAKGQGGPLRELVALARQEGVVVQEVDRRRLDSLDPSHSHQGVIALAAPYRYAELDELFAHAAATGEAPLFFVLDGVEDPQNLGSLIRSADGAGVHGVIIRERRAAPLTEAAVKASAGAVEYVPVARVTNIARTLEELKQRGLWIVGAHQDARTLYYQADLTGPLAMVIGSEGKGMSPLVAKHCDVLVRIPMMGKVSSLNAAIAGALLAYEVRRQRATRAPHQR